MDSGFSTDRNAWVKLATLSVTGASVNIIDLAGTKKLCSFYRVKNSGTGTIVLNQITFVGSMD